MYTVYMGRAFMTMKGADIVNSGKIVFVDNEAKTVEVEFKDNKRDYFSFDEIDWRKTKNSFVAKAKESAKKELPPITQKGLEVDQRKSENKPKVETIFSVVDRKEKLREEKRAQRAFENEPKKKAFEELPDHEDIITDNDVDPKFDDRDGSEPEYHGPGTNEISLDNFDVLTRLNKDLKTASRELGPKEARFLLDNYYGFQRQRIRFANQKKALGESGEPSKVIQHFLEQAEMVEGEMRLALSLYANGHPMGVRMQQIHGIGPVLASGYLSHIDINRARTAGAFWRYCGLDPTAKWEKGQKRPWNPTLKRVGWLVGESFNKVRKSEKDFYGKLIDQRREYETNKNLNGEYAETVQDILDSKKFSKSTDAYKWYSGCFKPHHFQEFMKLTGKDVVKRPAYLKSVEDKPGSGVQMLSPGHLFSRCKRRAVYIFVSHLFECWWEYQYNSPPPIPYIMAKDPEKHSHYIERPDCLKVL